MTYPLPNAFLCGFIMTLIENFYSYHFLKKCFQVVFVGDFHLWIILLSFYAYCTELMITQTLTIIFYYLFFFHRCLANESMCCRSERLKPIVSRLQLLFPLSKLDPLT